MVGPPPRLRKRRESRGLRYSRLAVRPLAGEFGSAASYCPAVDVEELLSLVSGADQSFRPTARHPTRFLEEADGGGVAAHVVAVPGVEL
jgi:hypothetical protein